MATITMAAGSRVPAAAPATRNVFLYVVRGEITVDGESAKRVPPRRDE